MLHGRDVERSYLTTLLDSARQGRAGAVVVTGDAGVGKSVLLDDLRNAAAEMRVLVCQGVESESPLAFAALHRLLRPVLARLDRLPAPQGRALRVAFGQEEGAAVEPFLVAIATLSMLTTAAEDQPVLCIVDDAHWLDAASSDALLFAARRLEADPVVIVFAARDGVTPGFEHEGVPGLPLTGLSADAALALLREHAENVSDEVCEQLLARTGGNPLALVELPRGLTAHQLVGTAALPQQLQLTAQVERVFLDRCRRLSSDVQTLLLITAADDSGQVATVRRACSLLNVDAAALREAEESGLVETDGLSIRVRHPLVRSAVYQAATAHERQTVHRAIADVLEEVDDPDRRAWHIAAAATGPDQEAASALQQAAVRAERRGGYMAAAAAFERAAELTASQQPRASHLFAAARNAWSNGETSRAGRLLIAARQLAEDDLLLADIDRLRGRIEVNVGSALDAHQIFTRAADTVRTHDPARALEMTVAAKLLEVYGAVARPSSAPDGLAEATAGPDEARYRCLQHLLVCLTRAQQGDWSGAVDGLGQTLAASAEVTHPDVLGNVGNAALHIGDDAGHRLSFDVMLSDARNNGAVMLVLYALPRLAFSQLLAGAWAEIRAGAQEALSLIASAGQRPLTAAPLAWLALLGALQGHEDFKDLLSSAEEAAGSQTLGILSTPVHDVLHWAKGTHAANSGEALTALHHFGQIRTPALNRMTALDRVEAAVRAQDLERAAAAALELSDFADGTRWPWASAAADHARALLAPADAAGALFESSLVHHATSNRPYDRARTELAYGEFLRRNNHRVDARTHLRLALETFQDLQALPLSDRASQELRGSGETARKRDPSTQIALTPTELRIAQMVSQGMSNKDVAAACWVSPRTVAFHLRNVFNKAGVTSRGELAQLQLS